MNRILFLLVACFGFAMDASELQVLYTGKLLGYGRKCEHVEMHERPAKMGAIPVYDRHCIGAAGYGDKLRRLIAAKRTKNSLLIGLGNHFALDFGSRTVVVVSTTGARELVDKDELFYFDPAKGTGRGKMMRDPAGWILRRDLGDVKGDESLLKEYSGGDITIPGETVADWVAATGYRALVPGKHDFYFGPERLREISRLLETKNVRVLGVNLLIAATRLDPPEKRLDYMWTRNYLKSYGAVKLKLPKKVLPWIREIEVEGLKNSLGVQQVGKTVTIYPAPNVNTAASSNGLVALQQVGTTSKYRMEKASARLEPGSYHFCVDLAVTPPPTPARLCNVVEVQQPYFEYGTTASLPYLVANGEDAVVMGAVVPGLEKLVGKLGTKWIDPDGRYDLRVDTAEAAEALQQVLDYCQDKEDCAPGRKLVLAAQMPLAAARAVNVKLKGAFQLVIAEASHVTGTAMEEAKYAAGHPALTVAPLPPYDPEKCGELSVHVQAVLLDKAGTGEMVSQGYKDGTITLPAIAFPSRITADINAALWRLEPRLPAKEAVEGFKMLTLALMRQRENASVGACQQL